MFNRQDWTNHRGTLWLTFRTEIKWIEDWSDPDFEERCPVNDFYKSDCRFIKGFYRFIQGRRTPLSVIDPVSYLISFTNPPFRPLTLPDIPKSFQDCLRTLSSSSLRTNPDTFMGPFRLFLGFEWGGGLVLRDFFIVHFRFRLNILRTTQNFRTVLLMCLGVTFLTF